MYRSQAQARRFVDLSGVTVHARKPSRKTGRTTGSTRTCTLEGCRGIRIGVRWPNRKCPTWPCSKGMDINSKGEWVIV